MDDNIATPTYCGESSRSAFRRGAEHFSLYTNRFKSSFMLRHCQLAHNGVFGDKGGMGDFSLEHISTFKDNLTRILEEAVLIQALEEDDKVECLNSKAEYFGAEYVPPCFPKGPAQVFH